MRWVFQLFEGINLIGMAIGDTLISQVDGMNEVGRTVARQLGKGVLRLYSDFSGQGVLNVSSRVEVSTHGLESIKPIFD